MADSYTVRAASIRGVEVLPVNVEVDLSGGIPGMTVVGMADTSIMEARSRIRCALRAAGFDVPRQQITVNLAPGDVRKVGAGFDLPIAAGILAASRQVPLDGFDDAVFVGELALDGRLTAVKGEVAYQLYARQHHLTLVEAADAPHTVLENVERRALSSIGELRKGLRNLSEPNGPMPEERHKVLYDFSDVVAQELAKRAMVIAAVGEHSLLMVGSPGSGKSMLAQRLPSILPKLEGRALEEALLIHSVAGEDLSDLARGERPLRCPHHTVSLAGLVGGGRPVRPGEISLAHQGVLFLDELAEFPTHALQTLRQPLEERCVRIVRAEGAYRFPARFMFLAASNPCPCGNYGDPDRPCTCAPARIERYQEKLGGPLADRIDMVLTIVRPDAASIVKGEEGASSRELAEVVMRAREFRSWREHEGDEGRTTSFRELELSHDASDTLVALAQRMNLTGRSMSRLARIARTIADISEKKTVEAAHVLEAVAYRGTRR